MAATPIRIVVVDDSPLYRRTVCNILEKQPNMQVVAEAGDGLYAIQAVKIHRPDVVLMDVTMPMLDGVEASACRCLPKGGSPREITEEIMTPGI